MSTASDEVWRSQQTSTSQRLDKMRHDRMFTDLIIECEGKEFHVHRLHMCSSAPYFTKLLESKVEEANAGKVLLDDIKAETMEIILEFIYTGTLPTFHDDKKELLLNFLQATHMLQIELLFNYYRENIHEEITYTNFIEVLETAERYDCQEVLADIFSFLADNFNLVFMKPEFSKLGLSHLKRLFSQTELKVGWADCMVKGILRWAEFDKDERVGVMGDLIDLVQLDTLSNEYLKILLNDEPLVKDSPVVLKSLASLACSRLSKPYTDRRLLAFVQEVNVSTMLEFSFSSLIWEKTTVLPFKLDRGSAIACVGDDVYFIGGGEGTSVFDINPLTCVKRYSRTDNIVTNFCSLNSSIAQAGAAVLNGHLYVVGGITKIGGKGGPPEKNVQRITVANGNCVFVASTHEKHNVPKVFPSAHHLYVLGCENGTNIGVEQYDCYNDCWTVVTRLPGDVAWCSATLVETKLFVIRKMTEQKMHIFDFATEYWESRDMFDGPAISNGLWGVNGDQSILVRDAKLRTLHVYDYKEAKWIKTVEFTQQGYWKASLTVVV